MSRCRSLAALRVLSDNQRSSTLTERLIKSFGTGVASSRNAQLAMLKFHSCKVTAREDFQDELLKSCLEYFKDFSIKVACFHDLQPYVPHLDRIRQQELIKLCGYVAREIRPSLESSEVSISSSFIASY